MKQKKIQYKILIVFLNFITSLGIILLFSINISILNKGFDKYNTAWILVIIVFIRIGVIVFFTLYLYRKWFNQESIYTSDGFFLFGLFFNILIYGKCFDLFYYLSFATEEMEVMFLLLTLKLRYLIIILEAIPLLFLGLEVVVNFIKIYFKKLSENKLKKIRQIIIITFLSIISILIIIAPNSTFIINLFPIIVFGTILGLTIMFFFMYRMKLLSQANGLIIGFGFILFMISSIIRSILTTQFDPVYVIISEIIDMFVFFIIFFGFVKKPNYSS